MGWIEDLYGSLVGLDTAPLIYYIDEDPVYLPVVAPLFDSIADGRIVAVTSTITLVEVLTKPLREGRHDLASVYRDLLLTGEGIEMRSVSPEIAEAAAQLRANYGLRTPDALQIATAAAADARVFVTNDMRLASITDVRMVVLSQARAEL